MPAWLQKLVIANQLATGKSLSKVVHYKLDYSTGYMCGHYANGWNRSWSEVIMIKHFFTVYVWYLC